MQSPRIEQEFRGDLPTDGSARINTWRIFCRLDGRYDPKSKTLIAGLADGHCLRPFLESGDVVWVDSALESRPGDVVMTTMLYRKRVNPNVLGAMSGPEYVQRPALKQLQIVDGVQWLCCADGSVPVPAGHKIIGPVVAWHRKRAGWLRWRVPLRKMNFQPDARSKLAANS